MDTKKEKTEVKSASSSATESETSGAAGSSTSGGGNKPGFEDVTESDETAVSRVTIKDLFQEEGGTKRSLSAAGNTSSEGSALPDVAKGAHDNPQTQARKKSKKDLNREMIRLETFDVLVMNNRDPLSIPKASLAKNGFYYRNGNGRVICAFCEITFEPNISNLNGKFLSNFHRGKNEDCLLVNNMPSSNIPLGKSGKFKNFRFELHRLISMKSMDKWTSPYKPKILAKQGFYWTGGANLAFRCYFCRLEIEDWDWEGESTANDEVQLAELRDEHRHPGRAQQCPMLLGVFPQGDENVPLTMANDEQLAPEHEDLVFWPPPELTAEVLEANTFEVSVSAHPELCKVEDRLATFQVLERYGDVVIPQPWPASLRGRDLPRRLAEAGFLYTSFSDFVYCFHCRGMLRDWSVEQEPWEWHARHFPACSFLLLNKGKHYVSQVQQQQPHAPQQQLPRVIDLSSADNSRVEDTISRCYPEPRAARIVDCGAPTSARVCRTCGDARSPERALCLPCNCVSPQCVGCSLANPFCLVCRELKYRVIRIVLPPNID